MNKRNDNGIAVSADRYSRHAVSFGSVVGMGRLWLCALLVCCAVLAPAQAARHPAPSPRVAIVSVHLSYQPSLMRAAAERKSPEMVVDLYGLGRGLLPGIGTVDLGSYDLVVLEGVSPRLLQHRDALQTVAQRTRVLVLKGDKWVQGNVPRTAVPDAIKYWRNATVENYTRLLAYFGVQLLGMKGRVAPPITYPENAFYHPAHTGSFATLEGYLVWARQRYEHPGDRPRVGLVFYRSQVLGNDAAVIDALIREIERQGGFPIPLWREDSPGSLESLIKDNGTSAVDVLILCASQINYVNHEAGVAAARELGVVVLGCSTDHHRTPDQWRAAHGGFVPWQSDQVALSEVSGIVEPMMVGARVVRPDGTVVEKPLPEQVSWRVARALSWARLHNMPNDEKKIVITYYSEGANKGDVGSDPDTYLNAQASLAVLLRQLRTAGYDVGDQPLPNAQELAQLMAQYGSNVSSGLWGGDNHAGATGVLAEKANAELARRVAKGHAVAISLSQYLDWYRQLPQKLRSATEARWGAPPGKIMVYTNDAGKQMIVIPALRFGKVILAPHPVWGYLQNAEALTSTNALPPHHQYIAFYLWMQKGYEADAYVSVFSQLALMPGKLEGPARSDWVGTLIGNVPHIKPIPLHSNAGMGAKRRANAVTIGYMVPFAQAGLPPDLEALQDLLEKAVQTAGKDRSTRRAVRQKAQSLAKELDFKPMDSPWDTLVAKLRDFLREVATSVVPIGTHVLGQSPSPKLTARMIHAMLAGNMSETPPRVETIRAVIADDTADVTTDLAKRITEYAERIAAASGEVEAILSALAGHYIPPGPMGDPVGNPASLPSGRNPYTLATRKLPTKKAWKIGSRLAKELVQSYKLEHGHVPSKVAFVLWASESIRTKGVLEAQILALLGVRPVWNPQGEVTGVELIDRQKLGRPRVDVLVTTSGTYRDHFHDKIVMITKAVRQAASIKANDNPVRANSLHIARKLRKAGVPAEKAWRLATLRVYSTAPGAYSPLTQFAVEAGSKWDDDRLTRLYTNRLGHAYGINISGKPAVQSFVAQMSGVDAAVFSRSSNIYGLLDTSMPAAYLGGLSMAIRKHTGQRIDNYIVNLESPRAKEAHLESLARAFGRELRARYFNPAWIKGMMKSGYNGARYMANLTAHMLLWDVTTPQLVTDAHWAKVKAIYLDDKYELGLDKYFAQHNPYAHQQLIETLLSAIDRGLWEAKASVRKQLKKALAKSVARYGADCALASCKAMKVSMTQPAPAMETSTNTARSSRPQPSPTKANVTTKVEGYALEPRKPNTQRPASTQALLWLSLAAMILFSVGLLRRPRW